MTHGAENSAVMLRQKTSSRSALLVAAICLLVALLIIVAIYGQNQRMRADVAEQKLATHEQEQGYFRKFTSFPNDDVAAYAALLDKGPVDPVRIALRIAYSNYLLTTAVGKGHMRITKLLLDRGWDANSALATAILRQECVYDGQDWSRESGYGQAVVGTRRADQR